MTAALPPLEREPLMATASMMTGLDDWGTDDFIPSLDLMLSDMHTHANLNEAGVASQVQDMLRLLTNRLRFTRDLREHPEILDQELVPPIIILGLPRTGTSKLHRTISSDPDMQRLEVWRLLNPAPIEPGDPQTRIEMGEQFEAALRQVPAFMAAHPMEAHEPDEDLWLMELTFDAPVASHRMYMPNHRKWIADRQDSVYTHVRDVLKYLQWQDGGARNRPWVLKSPMHIGQVAVLHQLYPGAVFVQCHRDVKTVLGSYCSLLEAARGMYTDHVDLESLGPDYAQFWGNYTERNMAARKTFPDLNIYDVSYQQIRDDVDGIVGEIYRRADRPVTAKAKAGFDAYNSRRPEGHFGSHKYDPSRWGVTDELVAETFASYQAAFAELLS